jgi:hypothetical protein
MVSARGTWSPVVAVPPLRAEERRDPVDALVERVDVGG